MERYSKSTGKHEEIRAAGAERSVPAALPKMKKVLMLTKYFLPHIGGVEIHVDKVATELGKRGYEVTVFCANTEKARYSEVRNGYVIIRDYREAYTNWRKYDIVHVHDFEQFIPAGYGCDRQFITFHGYEGHVPPQEGIVKTRQAISKKVLGTIHVGNYLRKWYGTHHKNDLTVLGGVDKPGIYQKRHPEKPFKIAYVGRMSEDKRTDLYQKAMEKIEETTLEVYTDLPNHQIRSMWDKHDLAFCNGQLSMLEAMACGVPIIALESNKMVKDMLKDFPACRAGSVEEIVGLTTAFINDPDDLYCEHSYSGWKFACQHDWSKVADIYERLWQQAV